MKQQLSTILLAIATTTAALGADPAPAAPAAPPPVPVPAPAAVPTNPAAPADAPARKIGKEEFSYALGMVLASNWKRQSIEVTPDDVISGIKDALAGKTRIDEKAANEVLNEFRKDMIARQNEERRIKGEKNKAEGEAFLKANKDKAGIITLTNGLQYKVVAEGKGDPPKLSDTVKVNYRGTLVDGTEFDASKPGEPASFRVGGVIRGWSQALQMMKPGAKWQLFIPSDLAYGPRGSGAKIGPDTTLLFDVELVGVNPPPVATNAPPKTQPVTSDIIRVPSAEELKKGAKPEVIKAEDLEKVKAAEKAKAQQTNKKEEQ